MAEFHSFIWRDSVPSFGGVLHCKCGWTMLANNKMLSSLRKHQCVYHIDELSDFGVLFFYGKEVEILEVLIIGCRTAIEHDGIETSPFATYNVFQNKMLPELLAYTFMGFHTINLMMDKQGTDGIETGIIHTVHCRIVIAIGYMVFDFGQ